MIPPNDAPSLKSIEKSGSLSNVQFLTSTAASVDLPEPVFPDPDSASLLLPQPAVPIIIDIARALAISLFLKITFSLFFILLTILRKNSL